MAGLYIHIPFCRDACTYCDFHFSISLGQLKPMLAAIKKEITNEKNYLEGEELSTIYFGGGTPSTISPVQLESIFATINTHYRVRSDAEITLEANPDDLDHSYLDSLMKTPVNRLSIGIQSFHDEDLKFMNRRHTASQSIACVENAYKSGFDNLNLDLIYGLPGMNLKRWQENLDIMLNLKPAHIAAYHLTYEAGTRLDYRRKKKKISPAGENMSFDHYALLVDRLTNEGYLHYEISNFALPGKISKHNSAYWKGENYLGIGPSAHSFNGKSRRWNKAKNTSYIRGIEEGIQVYETETLNEKEKFHDYLMTSLRTVWGINTEYVKEEWGIKYYEHMMKEAAQFLQSGKMTRNNSSLSLTDEGMFIADHVISTLFTE